MNIMNHVNIAELVTVTATRLPNTANFAVSIVSMDPSKRVVLDESALLKMNEMVTEKAASFEARDPRAQT